MEAQPPEKPPDWGIAQNGGNKDANRKELQVFFRDKVLGDKQVPPIGNVLISLKKSWSQSITRVEIDFCPR